MDDTTYALRIGKANAMPARTWHFLKMNDCDVEIPEGLALSPRVEHDVPWHARGAADEFENALADAQERWEADHPEPTEQELAEKAAYLAAEADATYGGTALSAYQMNADAIEEARSLSLAFENGLGEETSAYLRYAAGDPIVVAARPDEHVKARIVVNAADKAISAASVDVIADENATVELTMIVDSSEAAEGSAGIAGTTMRIFADDGASVQVSRVQTLDEGYVDFDDTGLFAADSAQVNVSQTVLGGSKTYTGFAADLRGTASKLDIGTRYLGHGDQVHDFNYMVRHHGPKTECSLNANGVLAGTSSKTLRGTIDLIRGAKGAQGSEQETVLLVDEGVRNKTVPVILCNEDDVAGNHGATIGHIRAEQLFYLESRGLSQLDAERMFVGAAIEQAYIESADERAREGISRLGEKIVPGFSNLVDEEA